MYVRPTSVYHEPSKLYDSQISIYLKAYVRSYMSIRENIGRSKSWFGHLKLKEFKELKKKIIICFCFIVFLMYNRRIGEWNNI